MKSNATYELSRKKAFVTGGTKGIGEAIVRQIETCRGNGYDHGSYLAAKSRVAGTLRSGRYQYA